MPTPIPSGQRVSPFGKGNRRRAAPEAVRTSTRSDGAAACLSPERTAASPSGAQAEGHRRYERGHGEQVARGEGARSPRAARSPGRDLHASDEMSRVLSPEAPRPSSPTNSPRSSPVHHRYERGHYDGLASSAECPEPAVGDRVAGGSSSNHHVLTRFHNGEAGGDRLHHVAEVQHATKTEDGTFRQEKATRSPGRRRLSPSPSPADQDWAPAAVGAKVAETADGWAAYREPRPGGGVEVSWRRIANPDDTAFSTSHTKLSLAEVVSGTGDGCISSFNVGAPKWAQEGKGDPARLKRLQMSSFSKHRIDEAPEQDSSSPRSVFARRRAAAKELEYDDWHRLQSRQTKAAVRGPPPTPQQWLQHKIQEAKTIPAVASILEPRELEEFMHQMAESTIDELEVHNHEFSDKIRRGNGVPQELNAWKFLQTFAQGCIQREVAKLDVIARAKTGSVPQTPQTPLASQFKNLDSPTALAIGSIDAAYALQTPEQQYDVATPVAEDAGRNASTVAESSSAPTSERVEIADVPDKAARKEMFTRMDVRRTGKLTLDEIRHGIEQSYPHLNHRPALMRAYRAAEVNGDGLIGRREFRLLLEYLVFFCQAWQDFEQFDYDDKHTLSKSDFIACCEQLGLLSTVEAGEEFHVVDKDDSGYVSFEEFCCWAGINKIGTTKQLWPKYRIDMAEIPNRHARVVSPDKGGRLSKPNRVWLQNKWQDSPKDILPQTLAMVGMDRAPDPLTSPPRSARLSSPVRASQQRAATDSTGTSLTSPERHKPSHQLTSPERRTLRNRESARQDPGSGDDAAGADASLAVSLTGVWRAIGERRDGTKVHQAIYIRHEQDGRVTGGHVDGVNGFFVIKDGTVDGSTVWFRQEYSNGNRVVWEATIEQTYRTSGIMVPKLVDGTWKGSNLQGSFSASLETMRDPEATCSVATTIRRKGKTAASSAGTASSTKQPAPQVHPAPSHPEVDQVGVGAEAVPETPAQSTLFLSSPTSSSTHHEIKVGRLHHHILTGIWVADDTYGTRQSEKFVLVHDTRSGRIRGHSIQEDGDDSFEIVQGVLEGRSIKFVQKFHDGMETLWCVLTLLLSKSIMVQAVLTSECVRLCPYVCTRIQGGNG